MASNPVTRPAADDGAEPMRRGPTAPRVPTRARRWCWRLLAILLGLAPFVACELALRVGGIAATDRTADPFLDFQGVRPLFVRNPATDRFEVPADRLVFFPPESFACHKSPREFRVFCLGGSTVHGHPYAFETAFSRWLELALGAADPSRTWEVVNCGGVSYASYRLVPILKEVLEYEPDLVISYSGHNEFLEDRSYGRLRAYSPTFVALYSAASHLRLFRVATHAYRRLDRPASEPTRSVLPVEVDALLDYRGGLEDYHRDDDWTQAVMRHFEFNLYRMAAAARARQVPVILVQPIVNLRDCPPFKSEADPRLSPEASRHFMQLWHQARQNSTDLAREIALLHEALRIDPRHAAVHFHLAKCYEALGRAAEARHHFVRAKEEDVCPLRIREPMFDAIARVAAATGTRLVDLRPLFEPDCDLRIPGNEVLLDHVHPTIEGHQRIALRLVDELVAMGILQPRPGWHAERKRAFQDQLGELDEVYFARGRMRLEGLRLWSQGRASKIRPGKPRASTPPFTGATESRP